MLHLIIKHTVLSLGPRLLLGRFTGQRVIVNALFNVDWAEEFSALDGATAFEVKDYLIEQERVDFVEIDQEIFPGKFTNRKYEL